MSTALYLLRSSNVAARKIGDELMIMFAQGRLPTSAALLHRGDARIAWGTSSETEGNGELSPRMAPAAR